MTVRIYDTAGKPHDIKASGAVTQGEHADLVRAKHGLPVWEKVIIRRADGQPFLAEDRGKYTLTTVYDEDDDTRLRISVRFDAPDRTYSTEEIRFDETGGLDSLMTE
jgi:hypothetical protein